MPDAAGQELDVPTVIRATVIALATAASAAAAQTWIHPLGVPQTTYPDVILAVIEISEGSITKYEIDRTTGHIVVDRFQSMPVRYPANYGAIPSSLAGDGDALDVLVLAREPVVPGRSCAYGRSGRSR